MATHVAGANLTYTCLGNNTYLFRLFLYRDCAGVSLGTAAPITISSASCGFSTNITLNETQVNTNINQPCSNTVTNCNGGNAPGLEEHIYEGTYTLPQQCTDWTFGWSLCCRNDAITTVNGAGNYSMYIQSTLNNVAAPCNSSPDFLDRPVNFLCINQPACISNASFDTNGDSVAYKLVPCKDTDFNTTVPLNGGLTTLTPLNSSNGITINPNTGAICLTPNKIQRGILAVEVSEYRNGVLIGTVIRDLQIVIYQCANKVPEVPDFSSVYGGGNVQVEICPGTPFSFTFPCRDTDGNNITLSGNSPMPGSSLTFNNAVQPPTATFSWTPTPADAGPSNTFTIRAQDDACPFNGVSNYAFNIVVKATFDVDIVSTPVCIGNATTMTATPFGSPGTFTPPFNFTWSGSDGVSGTANNVMTSTITHTYPFPGTYPVSVNVKDSQGCSGTFTTNVVVKPLPDITVDPPKARLCNGASIQVQAAGGTPGTYSWAPTTGISGANCPNCDNPIISPTQTTVYTVTATGPNGCVGTTTFVAEIAPPPPPAACNTIFVKSDGNPNGMGTKADPASLARGLELARCQSATIIMAIGVYNTDTAITNVTDNTTIDGSYDPTQNWLKTNAGISEIHRSAANIELNPDRITAIALNSVNGFRFQDVVLTTDNAALGGSTAGSTVLPPTSTYGFYFRNCGNYQVVRCRVYPGDATNGTPGEPGLLGFPGSSGSSGAGGVGGAGGPNGSNGGKGGNGAFNAAGQPGSGVGGGSAGNAGANGANGVNGVGGTMTGGFYFPGGAGTAGAGGGGGGGGTGTSNGGGGGGGGGGAGGLGGTGGGGSFCVYAFNNKPGAVVDDCDLDPGAPGVGGAGGVGGLGGNGGAGWGNTIMAGGKGGNGGKGGDGASGIKQRVYANGSPIGVTASVDSLYNFAPEHIIKVGPDFCTQRDIDFSNTKAGSSYLWNHGASSTPPTSPSTSATIQYTNIGRKTVQLSVDGTNYTYTGFYPILSTPGASTPDIITDKDSVCFGETFEYFTSSILTASNFIWSVKYLPTNTIIGGASGPTKDTLTNVPFNQIGAYEISLQIDSDCCGLSPIVKDTVYVLELPILALTGKSPICTGGSSTIRANHNGKYVFWSNGTIADSITVTPTVTTTYKAIVRNQFGCVSDSVAFTVVVEPSPTITATPPSASICQDETVGITLSGAATYQWSRVSDGVIMPFTPSTGTTYVLSAQQAGAYNVVGYSALGCPSAPVLVFISVKNGLIPDLAAQPDSICKGGSSVITIPNQVANAAYWLSLTDDYNAAVIGGNVLATINPNTTLLNFPTGPLFQPTTYYIFVQGQDPQNNCPNILPDSITVNLYPDPVFAFPDTIKGCITARINSPIINPVLYQYKWGSVASGNINVPNSQSFIDVTVTGKYWLEVTELIHGCKYRDTVNVAIGSQSPNFTFTNQCVANDYTFTDQTTTVNDAIVGWFWDFGDGGTAFIQNPTHAYTTSGNKTVKLRTLTALGCADSVTKIANVFAGPLTSFTAPPVCDGANTQFTSTATIAGGTISTYEWDMNNDGAFELSGQSLNQTFAPGSYTIVHRTTSSNGCMSTASQIVVVNPNPVADFTATTVCRNEPTTFISSSTVSTGSIVKYEWDFEGTGAFVVGNATTTHVYPAGASSTYPAVLRVTTDNGCTGTISVQVQVYELPTASFTATSVCQSVATAFTSTSSSPAATGAISEFAWDFDGNGVYDQTGPNDSPTFIYPNAGTFNARLRVTTVTGCRDSVVVQVIVHPLPKAGFSFNEVCFPSATTFNSTSTVSGSGNNISTFAWDFGGLGASASANPTFNFAAGTYNVSLTVTTNNACTDAITQTITVNPKPNADFTTADICYGKIANFTSGSTVSTGTIANYIWDFDGNGVNDKQGATETTPTFFYAVEGTYNARLIVVTDKGCRDTVVKQIVVFPKPIADFSAPTVCEGNPTQFFDNTFISSGTIVEYAWDFNNSGAFSVSNATPTFNYSAPGDHLVGLRVTSDNGCMDTVFKTITVAPVPVADFQPTSVCAQTATTMDANNSIVLPPASIISYDWDFDGNPATLEAFGKVTTNVFPNPGTTNVTLFITTGDGCRSSVTKSVVVYPNPTAVITVANDTVCFPSSLNFDALGSTIQASNLPSAIVQYAWDFDNNGTIDDVNPVAAHFYPVAGSYTVSLTVTTNDGCNNKATKLVVVLPKPKPNFIAPSVCQNDSMLLDASLSTVNAPSSIVLYEWDINADGVTDLTGKTAKHPFASFGDFPVTLKVTTEGGCEASITKIVNVRETPFAQFDMKATECLKTPVTVKFTGVKPAGSQAIWDFDGGIPILSGNDPQFGEWDVKWLQIGTYNVSLTMIANSCTTTYAKSIEILSIPIVDAGDDVAICKGESIVLGEADFLNPSTSNCQFYWTTDPNAFPGSPSATWLDDPFTLHPTASPLVTTTYYMQGICGGCISNIDSVKVYVNPRPTILIGTNEVKFCKGAGGVPICFNVTGGVPNYHYTYIPETGISNTNSNCPIANPDVTTLYKIIASDSNGCQSDTGYILVKVLPNPIADAGADRYICKGTEGGVQLNGSASGGGFGSYLYHWTPEAGLSNPNIANPWATPDTTTIYQLVVISNQTGCSSVPNTLDTLQTVVVEIVPIPVADAGPDTVHICEGEHIMIGGLPSNISSVDTIFVWTPTDGLSHPNRNFTDAKPAFTTTYNLTVISKGCVSEADPITVQVHARPTIAVRDVFETCPGSGVMLDAVVGGSPGPFTYLWSPAAGLDDPTLLKPTASPSVTTTYTLSVFDGNCQSPTQETALVQVLPVPVLNTNPNNKPYRICPEQDDSLTMEATITTNLSPYSVVWRPGAGLSDSTKLNTKVKPAETTTYTLYVTLGQCTVTQTLKVEVLASVSAAAEGDRDTICQGESVTLTAAGGVGSASYTWSWNDPINGIQQFNGQIFTATPDKTTDYILTTSESACKDNVIVTITVIPGAAPDFQHSSPNGCEGLEVSFRDLSTGVINAYIWDFGDGSPVSNEQNPTHIYAAAGEYRATLTVVSENGCGYNKRSAQISVGGGQSAEFITEPMYPVDSLMLPDATVHFFDQSSSAIAWQWQFGDDATSIEQNPVHTYKAAGVYYPVLTIIDESGCVAEVKNGPINVYAPTLFIPNVFTPGDGNGINDVWKPIYDGTASYKLKVFDRWGNLVFTSAQSQNGWDGRLANGVDAPAGVYFYTFELGNRKYDGSVTLMRVR